MVQRILFILSLALLTLTTTSLQAAPSKPTPKQLKELTVVARCERGLPSLSPRQRGLVKQLIGHMKARDAKGARKVWAKLRSHPKSAYLLNHALFHGIVVPEKKLAKFARKHRFYDDQAQRLAKHLKKLRKLRKRVGKGRLLVRRLRFAKYQAGGAVAVDEGTQRLDRNDLSDVIKEVESMQETVRNKRQMAGAAFQNFDQKANQLYNMLSSVMKAMNEMRMGTVRNLL